MSSRTFPKSCLLALALMSISVSAFAAPRGHDGPPPQRDHQDSDALSDSVRRIERTTRGQVLSAERIPFDGRDVNRIKTVDARGRVRVYMDDPSDPPHLRDMRDRNAGSGQELPDPPAN